MNLRLVPWDVQGHLAEEDVQMEGDECLGVLAVHLFPSFTITFIDDHGMIVPHHWPAWFLDVVLPSNVLHVRSSSPRKEKKKRPREVSSMAHVYNIHPLRTPEYKPVVQWLLESSNTSPIVIPWLDKQFRKASSRTLVCDNREVISFEHLLSMFERVSEDWFPCTICDEFDTSVQLATKDGIQWMFMKKDEKNGTFTSAVSTAKSLLREPFPMPLASDRLASSLVEG